MSNSKPCFECGGASRDGMCDPCHRKLIDDLCEIIREIKVENGLAPDAPATVCVRCRKVLWINNCGGMACDCFEELEPFFGRLEDPNADPRETGLEWDSNSAADRRERRARIAKETGKCSYCPPHGGENCRRQPRSDDHKNHRRQ